MTYYPKICQVTFDEAQEARMEWTGSHKGVAYSISYWGIGRMNDGHGMWNYYLIIPEQMIPEEFESLWLEPYEWGLEGHKKHVGYRYEECAMADLPWNGGATFYEKRGGFDGNLRSIRMGCDYGHLWDSEQGYPYCLSFIRRDAQQTCSAFRRKFPASLYRCSYDGKFYPAAEMRTHPENHDCLWWEGNRTKVHDKWKAGDMGLAND